MPTDIIDDNSSFPATVSVPAGADVRNAASVAVPFQTLSDRTAYLLAQIQPGDLRSIVLSPQQAQHIEGDWTHVGLEPGSMECTENSSRLSWDLGRLLPTGAIVQQVDALVTMGANMATLLRMQIELENRTPNFEALSLDAGTPDGSIFAEAGAASAGAIELFSLTTAVAGIPFTISRANVTTLSIRSRLDTNPLSPADIVHAVRVSFTDPGARSY